MKQARVEEKKSEQTEGETSLGDEQSEGETSLGDEQWTYTVFSEVIVSSELGRYTAYGIEAADAQGKLHRIVHDITCDRSALEALAALCNQLALSVCHLDDVIEDFLS